ncbi:MAG TPA: hypothetical protein DDY98_00220, partial [Ruminococcaceae bacterium]|nr:hypothetical protein [Oscillospiraceae bacterium]
VRYFSSFYYTILSVVLYLHFNNSIIDKRLRRYLKIIAAMILIFMFIRLEKYVSFFENKTVTRFLWYCFYVPILSIPQISFFATLTIGKPKDEKMPFYTAVTGIFTFILIILTLTNDWHQLVFRFHAGFTDATGGYTYAVFYYVICFWSVLLLALSIHSLMLQNSFDYAKKNAWLLFVYLFVFVVLLILTVSNVQTELWGREICEVPEMMSFIFGGLCVLCLSMGFIPSNSEYRALPSTTSLAVYMADSNGREVFQSKSWIPFPMKNTRKSNSFFLDKNTRVFCKPISGGCAYRQMDLSEINAINDELKEVADALSEEKELIRLENELKKKRAKIDAKSKTYDDIAVKVLPQSTVIESLVAQTKKNPENFDYNMRVVCIYVSYIKRMSNLMLMASEKEELERADLQLALAESVRYLRKTGIIADLFFDDIECRLSSERIVSAYHLFQIVLEEALPCLKAIQITLLDKEVRINVEGNGIQLTDRPGIRTQAEDGITTVKIPLNAEVFV